MSKGNRLRRVKVGTRATGLKSIGTVVAWLVGIVALAFCCSAVVRYWDEFAGYKGDVSVLGLCTGLLCLLAGYFLQAAAWCLLMAGLGSPISFLTALRSWSYSQVAKYVPGKVMVFVVRMQTCKEDGALRSKVLLGSALEIILSLFSALAIWAVSVLVGGRRVAEWPRFYVLLPIPIMLVFLHPKVITALMRRYYRWRGAGDGVELPEMTVGNILKPGLLYCLGWFLYGLSGYFILKGITGDSGDGMPLLGVTGAFTFAWAVGYLFVFAPGGLGAREGALTLAIASWAPLGVAAIMAILARLCQAGMDVGFACLWWVVNLIRNRADRAGDRTFSGRCASTMADKPE